MSESVEPDEPVGETGPVFDAGFDITYDTQFLNFHYGPETFPSKVEHRHLEDIRKHLRNPECEGPEIVCAIAADVAKHKDVAELERRMLRSSAVIFAQGQLGEEPIASQGHVHRVSSHSGWSPPEVYEVWSGRAIVYMQEHKGENPGSCFAVVANPGAVVVVPPAWAHAVMNMNPAEPLVFGVWSDSSCEVEYDEVQSRQGLAWYPVLDESGELTWTHNSNYVNTGLIVKKPRDYIDLGILPGIPLYRQFEAAPDCLQFVSKPALAAEKWENFIP